jgi:FKBP-type peptidyl-prolyl cis-trans isomerase FkpA
MAKRQHKTKKKGKGSSGFNRKQSEEFLLKNRGKQGVIETDSGLQYLIKVESDGEKPQSDSTVTVNQRITLIDGTIIGDTYKNNEPDTFSLSEAIEGLKEGIPMMNIGSKFRFFVPSDLAWGKRGAGDKIGPYATLIFDIKLEKIAP